MDDSFAETLITAYVAIASILTVYHMFALQSWGQRCETAAGNADVIMKSTTSDDVLRLHAQVTCKSALRSFPGIQLALVLGVLVYVTVLTARVGSAIHEVKDTYTVFPIMALDVVVIVATAAAIMSSGRAVRRALRLLSADVAVGV